ncbi:MAG: CHAT domain-containing protein [Anaerolineae bacterium]|nr:CHAT domain-containing protein [Anaerolineae bacterium]
MNTWLLKIADFDEEHKGFPITLFHGRLLPENLLNSDLIDSSWRPGSTLFNEAVAAFNKENPIGAELNKVGHDLFALVHSVLADHLDGESEGFLLLEVCEDLRPLSWERMLKDNVPYFAKGRLSCMRVREAAETSDAPPLSAADWPLRMLIVVGSDDEYVEKGEQIKVQEEINAITDILIPFEPNVDFEICRRPQPTQLKQLLNNANQSPHIFHFIGHGGIEDGNAFLEIKRDDGGIWRWWAADIRTQITNEFDKTNIRLAYINACLTSTENISSSVTDAFLDAKVPAVIGMRDDVRGSCAAQLAKAFYQTLRENPGKVAHALKTARDQLIGMHENGIQNLEWSSPCLEVRCKPHNILDVCIGVESREADFLKATLGNYVRSFVGRRREVREADSIARLPTTQMLALYGEKDIGKTSLVTMLLERLVLVGDKVHYIDLDHGDDKPRKPLSEFIQCTLEGPPEIDAFHRDAYDMLTQPFDLGRVDNQLRAEFDAAFNRLRACEGQLPNQNLIRELANILARLLLAAATSSPVILVYDHLRGLQEHELSSTFWPFLSELSNLDGVQVVVILDKTEAKQFLPSLNPAVLGMKHNVSLIELAELDDQHFEELVLEFIYRFHLINGRLEEFRNDYEEYKTFVRGLFYKLHGNARWSARFAVLKTLQER